MSSPGDPFDLSVDGRAVKTPVAIASMAGTVDAAYVAERAEHVGMAFIGGYSIDAPTIAASRQMAGEGRCEFLPGDPVAELSRQADLLSGLPVVGGINLRASTPEALAGLAGYLGDRVIYEIDAHCRQKPMIDAGAGEFLLNHPDILADMVRAVAREGVLVSVKIRAGVAGNDPGLARKLWDAGADLLHVDLMDAGYAKIRQIRNVSPAMIIANNSMQSFDRVMEMFSHGADLVSLARHSDIGTLAGLDAAIARYAKEFGWYNAPKQLCRGGDVRALTFCCLPVKDCPLLPTLQRLGLSREEYVEMKKEAVQGTRLQEGPYTCFGSLAWCCKVSSPCLLRDATLEQMGLSKKEYMQKKRELSRTIMGRVFPSRDGHEPG
ncbi:MAG TPA: methanogenesis marker 9 domain-containing protein [Methanomicrobiales archaeon]|jgi:TIM-barrel protein|nr:methanogenesis marker 9 domain-containing protein [Methanomicrobiales archaeon]